MNVIYERPMCLPDYSVIILQNSRTWINRIVEGRVRGLASSFPAILVTGARQTGKTALAAAVFPKRLMSPSTILSRF